MAQAQEAQVLAQEAQQEAQVLAREAQEELRQEAQVLALDQGEEGQEAEANGASAGATSSDGWDAVRRNGCVLETQTAGDGCTFPRPGDWVSVRYTGTTQQGRKEFSSGGVVDFLMDGRTVIKGLEAGLRQMALGEKGALKICAAYAVGGSDSRIPKDADMTLNVELLKVEKPPGAKEVLAFSASTRKEIVQGFYAKHDSSKPESDIDMVLSKPQYVKDFGKLCRGLEKKYGEHPATLWWSILAVPTILSPSLDDIQIVCPHVSGTVMEHKKIMRLV